MNTETPNNDTDLKPNKTAYMSEFRERQRREGIKRTTIILSKEEHKKIEASAKKYKEKLSPHIKQLALAKLEDKYIVPPDLEQKLSEAILIWRGIGNNLNQMARHSNEMKAFMHTGEIQLQLRRIEDTLKHCITQPKKEL